MVAIRRSTKNALIGLALLAGGIVTLKLAALFHSWTLVGVAMPTVFYGLVKTSESLPGREAPPESRRRSHRVPQTLR
ncbi:MAG: hypothetical protein KY455_01750 [Euryarchaeota archaeon]|nr:hypothetical protein [Euryarchaeota archaeon]